MIADTRANAEGSLAYVLLIPPHEKSLRMFCAVSLWLALATLGRVRDNPDVFAPASSVAIAASLKVPRGELMALVNELEGFVSNDIELRRHFESARDRVYLT
jgi:hypothetical protein